VRLRHEDVNAAIHRDLQTLQIKRTDIRQIIHSTLNVSCDDLNYHQNHQRTTLARRQSKLQGRFDCLLNVYLDGRVGEGTLQKKSEESKRELSLVNEASERGTKGGPGGQRNGRHGFRFFARGRRHLAAISLAGSPRDSGLGEFEPGTERHNSFFTKSKPFDLLVEGLTLWRKSG
jgi:hypothetical protein